MASLALMASAKPRHVPKVGFANGRIIGGHDAEPRKYPLLTNVSLVMEFLLQWVFEFASLALMVTRYLPKVGVANGRIVGGHDAEPRINLLFNPKKTGLFS